MNSQDEIHKQRIEAALARCEFNLAQNSARRPFEVAKEQLDFLMDFLLGKTADTDLLSKINLGLLAAREFEVRDMPLAELIYEVEGTKNYLLQRGPLHAT